MEELDLLVRSAAEGDPDAFGKIVQRFQDMAVGYAFSVLGDFHLAEDAAQEAFIQAYRDLPTLREPASFPSWFRKIIFKQCDRFTRDKRDVAVPIDSVGEIPSREIGPDRQAEERDLKDKILQAIQDLSEHERTTTSLFYIDGYSYNEIGDFLEVPVTTVKKRLHDARNRLKKRMVEMVRDNLSGNRPSRKTEFTDRVMRIIKPWELESEGLIQSWSCRGSDIWEMLCAAIAGDVEQIRRLLKRDPNLVRAEYWYTRPIHFAVREGHLEAVKTLIAAGADPTFIRYGGEDLTIVARDRGHEEVAKYIESMRGPLKKSHRIHEAVSCGDLEQVQDLIQEDPSVVGLRDAEGSTPLHLAVKTGRMDMVGLLIDHGAEPDAVQASGNTYVAEKFRPIDLAIWKSSFFMKRDNPKMVGYLLAKGASYSITIAAACGDLERVSVLLKENPDLANDAQPCGKRPLSSAIEHGHTEIAKLLLEHGADPSLPEGRYAPKGAALLAASDRNNLEIAEMLLERGADPNSYIDSCGTCIFAAKTTEMRNLMYRYGGRQDAFGYVWEGNFDAMAVMADSDPEGAGKSGCGGAFAAVVKKGDWDMLHMLLKRGVRVPDVVTGCRTYLWSNPDMTRVLLEHGMDSNLPNWQQVTPLHDLCASRDNVDETRIVLADLFLEFGADINARDEEYCSTPLGWAARCGTKNMVEHLLGRAAKTNLPEDQPWATPLAWAKKRGNNEIEEMLWQAGAKS